MPVLIDERLCDQNPACGAKRACRYDVFSYNPHVQKMEVNNDNCIDCGLCPRYCPAGAVRFARSAGELDQIRAQIAQSNETKDDLLAARYGVRPGDPRESGRNLGHVDCETFEHEVLESDMPVAVDFWAEWCAPCRVLAPTFKELAAQYEGKMKFVKLDTEECPDVPAEYGIRGIPTVLFFRGGQVVDQVVGAVPRRMLANTIEQVLAG